MSCVVHPELVAPAGDFEKMQVALAYGADAVYLAGEEFGLRSRSRNFTEIEIVRAADTAHSMGRRVYVTVNLFADDADLDRIARFVEFLYEAGVDGIIVADAGVLAVVLLNPLQAPQQRNSCVIESLEVGSGATSTVFTINDPDQQDATTIVWLSEAQGE